MAFPLPKEKIHRVSYRYLLIAVLIPTILLIAVNVLFYHFPLNRAYLSSINKWRILRHLKAPVNWLIVGDSSGDLGVNPDQLEEAFGGKAINLCTHGGMLTIDDTWFLDYYLQKNTHIDNVLMVHVYDIWHEEIQLEALAANPITTILWNDLQPDLNLSFEEYLNLYAGKYVPLFAQNESFKKVLVEPERLRFNNRLPTLPNGFTPYRNPATPENVERDVKDHLNFLDSHSFAMSDINKRSLAAIKNLAEQHQVHVYIAAGPLYEGLYQDTRFKKYYQELKNSLVQYCSSSDYLHYITDEPVTFPKSLMQNADHVIEEGAKQYTEALIKRIKQIR